MPLEALEDVGFDAKAIDGQTLVCQGKSVGLPLARLWRQIRMAKAAGWSTIGTPALIHCLSLNNEVYSWTMTIEASSKAKNQANDIPQIKQESHETSLATGTSLQLKSLALENQQTN